MCFVDEQDDWLLAASHRIDHALEALLELALDPSTGLQQAEVEYTEDDVLQRGRHVASSYSQGQALDHGGLADTGSTHQDRVVLSAAQKYVDALTDLPVAPDYGVDAPGAGVGGEVLGVLVEHAVLRGFLG